MSDCVICTIVDGVADVRLNRPERLNALDLATLDDLVTVERIHVREPSKPLILVHADGGIPLGWRRRVRIKLTPGVQPVANVS